MPPYSVWSDQFNKSEVQLNLRGIGWKNLMSKCLIQTEIFKGNQNKDECILKFDPNAVMNMRHKMAKESFKAIPAPQEQIQTDALRLLREEYHDRLMRHKQGKLIEAEIVKLTQSLEKCRLVVRKNLEESNGRTKPSWNRAKSNQRHRKLVKRVEGSEDEWVMGAWLRWPVDFGDEKTAGKDVRASVKAEEGSMFAPFRNCNSVEEDDEGGNEKENEFWKESEGEAGRTNDMKSLQEKFIIDEKKGENMRQMRETKNRINEKKISHALKNWKNEGSRKSKKTEGEMYRKKIEEFLSRLREKKTKEEIGSRTKRKTEMKKEKDEKTEEKLKKLMQEVKSSQREAHEKLHRVRSGFKADSKFLAKMEERRMERAKRRREFEDRKLRLEKEKEKMEQKREEEKRQKDEEEKRKRMKELKENRRAEKESQEERKREREKLRVKMELAVARYRFHLVRDYGLKPWVRLMRMRESQHQEAVRFFEERLKQRTLRRWAANVREQEELKIGRAVTFHEGILKRKCLATWKEWHRRSMKQNQVAVDWCDFKMTDSAFRRWRQFTKAEQASDTVKRNMAAIHYQRKLKRKYMQKLLEYPTVKRLEQAKENRKWKWRQKVKEILPDYEPVDIFEHS